MTTDKLGTTVARVNGAGDYPLMVDRGPHRRDRPARQPCDRKGFLHVVQSGGWDAQVLVGQRVEILTRDGAWCLASWAASRRT